MNLNQLQQQLQQKWQQQQKLMQLYEKKQLERKLPPRQSVGQAVCIHALDSTPLLDVVTEDVDNEESHGIVAENIKLATDQELKNFLRAMLPEFVANVNPHDYGLLDLMVQDDLMCDTDRESVSGKNVNTRKDQARKVWILLNELPVKEFTESILPFLCKHYPHVIPRQWCPGVQDASPTKCLRHNIMARVRLSTFADVLCETNCITLQTYKSVTSASGRQHDTEWSILWNSILFACLFTSAKVDILTEGIRNVLNKYKLKVPDNLEEWVSCGLPCTCSTVNLFRPPLPASPAPSAQHHRVSQWTMDTKQWQQRGSPAPSSLGYPDADVESGSSESTSVITITNRKRPATDGVQDAYSSQKKQRSKPSDAALREWAMDNKLSEETLQVLSEGDFTTLEDVKLLRKEKSMDLFQKHCKLPLKQCILLQNAIELIGIPQHMQTEQHRVAEISKMSSLGYLPGFTHPLDLNLV